MAKAGRVRESKATTKAVKATKAAKVATDGATVKRRHVPNPNGPRPKYGAPSRMIRRAHKWPKSVDVTLMEVAAHEGVTPSCVLRRALIAYAARTLGPDILGRFATDLAERADLIGLAETSAESASRRVFRD